MELSPGELLTTDLNGMLHHIQYSSLIMTSQLVEREHNPDSQEPEQLVCPECESDVIWGAVYFELVCDGCGLTVDGKTDRLRP
jgi:hypothetical protein